MKYNGGIKKEGKKNSEEFEDGYSLDEENVARWFLLRKWLISVVLWFCGLV